MALNLRPMETNNLIQQDEPYADTDTNCITLLFQ